MQEGSNQIQQAKTELENKENQFYATKKTTTAQLQTARLELEEAKQKISDGEKDTEPSFFQEYKCRLEKIPSRLYTRKAREIAAKRQGIAAAFYKSLYQEVSETCIMGEKE